MVDSLWFVLPSIVPLSFPLITKRTTYTSFYYNPHFHVFSFLFFFVATEIRCQEKSKGGLCYEVILGQPVTIPPFKQNKQQSTFDKKVSADEIARKLSEAEKRRLVSKIEIYCMPNCD